MKVNRVFGIRVVRGALMLVIGVLAVLSLGVQTTIAQTSITPVDAEESTANNMPSRCYNIPSGGDPECGCGKVLGATGTSNEGKCIDKDSIDTNGRSYIDNLTFTYHHYANDYKVGRGSADCASCASSGSGGAGLMELMIERRHRSRNLTQYGSFGPGVFTNYDTKVFLSEIEGGGLQLDLFDPRMKFFPRLVDGTPGSGDTLDGRFVDQKNQVFKEARLLDAQDTLTTDLNVAVAIEVEAFSGHVSRFELIDLAGDTTDNADLVGHWKFDTPASGSTAVDSTSGGHDGTILGATRVTTSGAPVPGGAGGALEFDGVNDSVNLGNPAAFNGAGKITLSAWIKPDTLSNDGSGPRNIVAHARANNIEKASVFLRIFNGQYQVGSFRNDGGVVDSQKAVVDAPSSDIGQWVHLTGVYDGQTWRLYRDGRLVAASQSQVGAVPSGHEWRIGSGVFNGVSRRHFDGQIDDVRIYDRNVLEGEISQIAQQRVLAGRLKSFTDRNGYAIDLTYKSFTQAQIDLSPERQWQIDTVTDAYNRTATFHYRNTQVAGQWVVEKIDLPNNTDVDYLYEDDLHLTKVVHADDTESTFTYTPDAATPRRRRRR